MDFCGERVPLENPDIWERYDKELLKKHLLAIQHTFVAKTQISIFLSSNLF